jgi:hypothetical protein
MTNYQISPYQAIQLLDATSKIVNPHLMGHLASLFPGLKLSRELALNLWVLQLTSIHNTSINEFDEVDYQKWRQGMEQLAGPMPMEHPKVQAMIEEFVKKEEAFRYPLFMDTSKEQTLKEHLRRDWFHTSTFDEVVKRVYDETGYHPLVSALKERKIGILPQLCAKAKRGMIPINGYVQESPSPVRASSEANLKYRLGKFIRTDEQIKYLQEAGWDATKPVIEGGIQAVSFQEWIWQKTRLTHAKHMRVGTPSDTIHITDSYTLLKSCEKGVDEDVTQMLFFMKSAFETEDEYPHKHKRLKGVWERYYTPFAVKMYFNQVFAEREPLEKRWVDSSDLEEGECRRARAVLALQYLSNKKVPRIFKDINFNDKYLMPWWKQDGESIRETIHLSLAYAPNIQWHAETTSPLKQPSFWRGSRLQMLRDEIKSIKRQDMNQLNRRTEEEIRTAWHWVNLALSDWVRSRELGVGMHAAENGKVCEKSAEMLFRVVPKEEDRSAWYETISYLSCLSPELAVKEKVCDAICLAALHEPSDKIDEQMCAFLHTWYAMKVEANPNQLNLPEQERSNIEGHLLKHQMKVSVKRQIQKKTL